MTVAIKGMDMPISTQKCQFFKRDSHFENGTQIVSEMICLVTGKKICDVDNILPLYSCKRCPDCPLTELPEENKDMSWEELVEKVKELKSDLLTVYEDYICYRLFEECWDCLEFGIDNQIVFRYMDEQKVIHTDKSFYQMWVIIKGLIGDER